VVKSEIEHVNKVESVTEAYTDSKGLTTSPDKKERQKPFCPSCGRDHVKEDTKKLQDWSARHGGSDPINATIAVTTDCPSGNCPSNKKRKSEGADEPEYHDESIIPVEKHHTDEPHTHKCGNKNEICLKCDPEKKKFDKDFSNADLTTALYTQNVDEGGMGKDGKPKKDETYIKVASTATSGTGGGIRGIPNEAYNQTAPNDQTVQNTELEDSGDKIEEDDNSDNKMIARVGDEMSPEKGLDIGQTDRRQDNTKLASGFRTEDNNNKLGDERGDSNAIKEDETDIKLASDFCPNCGKGITESQHKDYPETQSQGAFCPTCRQNKQIEERGKKEAISGEAMAAGIHRDLAARGQKVTRFSAGKKPKTFN